MRRGLRLARVLLSTQYALMLEYRAEIALWSLSGVVPLLMLGLWSQSEAGQALGLGATGLSRYFLAAFVVRQFTVVWVIHAFEEDALQGRLSPLLLQPLQPLWRYVAAHLAEQLTRLPFLAAIVAVVMLVHPQAAWWPSPGALLLTALFTWLGFAVNFLLQTSITMLCFWSERASALDRLLFFPYLALSGLLAPLEAFPPGVRSLALATPFAYQVAIPARLLAGEPVAIGPALAVLGAWLALLLPLCLILWRAGVRRYGAMGA
jgi:ABC-2 type transport system permease protein